MYTAYTHTCRYTAYVYDMHTRTYTHVQVRQSSGAFFYVSSMLQDLFTRVLPLPLPAFDPSTQQVRAGRGISSSSSSFLIHNIVINVIVMCAVQELLLTRQCIWRTADITYDTQLTTLRLLAELSCHYAAAVKSVDTSPGFQVLSLFSLSYSFCLCAFSPLSLVMFLCPLLLCCLLGCARRLCSSGLIVVATCASNFVVLHPVPSAVPHVLHVLCRMSCAGSVVLTCMGRLSLLCVGAGHAGGGDGVYAGCDGCRAARARQRHPLHGTWLPFAFLNPLHVTASCSVAIHVVAVNGMRACLVSLFVCCLFACVFAVTLLLPINGPSRSPSSAA